MPLSGRANGIARERTPSGITVCGQSISDVDVKHGHSAQEALCVAPQGDQKLQLARQLTAAALTGATGEAALFPNRVLCNAVCEDPAASTMDVSDCIGLADAYNNAGDSFMAPFDPPGSAEPRNCNVAIKSSCTVLSPALCAAP